MLKQAFACQGKLVAYAYTLLSDYGAAEDVVQNAFVVVAKKYNQYEPGSSILAWCRSIVRLEVLNYRRKHQRQIPVERLILFDSMDAAFAEQQQADHNTSGLEDLHICLGELPKRSREIIRLQYQEEKTYEEIGVNMGMKIEAVRKALYRIRNQLRECVEKRMAESNVT